MKAVIFDAYGVEPVLTDVQEPTCAPDGVIVKVAATGVCRSDWHAWMGHDPSPLPMVPGHEYAGVIAEVGSAVARWSVGDRVAVPFALGCGACDVCASGNMQVCLSQQQPGFTSWGSFAEYVAVPFADANLVALPESIDFIAAASLGCRFATAYRAVVARGRIASGEWLVVHGAGGVGLSAIQIGVALGARRRRCRRARAAPRGLHGALRRGALPLGRHERRGHPARLDAQRALIGFVGGPFTRPP